MTKNDGMHKEKPKQLYCSNCSSGITQDTKLKEDKNGVLRGNCTCCKKENVVFTDKLPEKKKAKDKLVKGMEISKEEAIKENKKLARLRVKTTEEKHQDTEEGLKQDLVAKQILDKYATVILREDAIFEKNGASIPNLHKVEDYTPDSYKGNEILWIPPKNCIRLEFEHAATKDNIRCIREWESAATALGFDFCITEHAGGKSPYFNMFNIKGLPVNEDGPIAKSLLIDLMLPEAIKAKLDRSNIGWTYSPVIGHSHWKKKYKGAVHEIIRGTNPIEQRNEYPKELLKQIKKSKVHYKSNAVQTRQQYSWVADFLINYCTKNRLPTGDRNHTIEKNLAVLIIHNKNRDKLMVEYLAVQNRKHDSLKGWITKVAKGDITEINVMEIKRYIRENEIPYDFPTKGAEQEKQPEEEIEAAYAKEMKLDADDPIVKQRMKERGRIVTTLKEGNVTVDLLNPKTAWKEIKCYEMNEDFVLQPIYYPVRIKKEILTRSGETETKVSKEMKIVLLLNDKNNNKKPIYPYSGSYSKSTFIINATEYKIPSEPFYLRSLPSPEVLERFLNGEKINGKELWKIKKAHRGKYLDVGEDNRKLIGQTAWDMGTYFFMVFNAYPYNDFFGLRGSGKNRSHEISNLTCFHSQMIATTRSISSIFRSIDAMGTTWLKNEAETLLGKNKDEDLLELCLEGYKKGSCIPLTSDIGKDKSRAPIYFDVYSPKSFTSDKNIYGAFGTRMIKYLQQQTAGMQGKIELNKEEGEKIRDDLYLLRLQDGCKIAKLAKTSIDELLKNCGLELVSRDREIFYPLLIITKEYGCKEEFKELVSFIKDYLEGLKKEIVDQPIAVVLRAVYALCYEEWKKNKAKDEFWINIQDIREEIIFNDPEAWRIKGKEGFEKKEIIRTSDTAKGYTNIKIGFRLRDLGFEEKRPVNKGNQRKIIFKLLKERAKILNIQIDDIIEEERYGTFLKEKGTPDIKVKKLMGLKDLIYKNTNAGFKINDDFFSNSNVDLSLLSQALESGLLEKQENGEYKWMKM